MARSKSPSRKESGRTRRTRGDVKEIKKVKVKPHKDQQGDIYCEYPIKKASPGAPLSVDDTICILCAKDQDYCEDFDEIDIGTAVYMVGESIHPYCASCKTNTYEKDLKA